ncbi:MAG TPA: hypothetical protein VFB54_12710 [Burkholderiales bacterium]|nr:hypothetical protein [Burkholderiales bacterium]
MGLLRSLYYALFIVLLQVQSSWAAEPLLLRTQIVNDEQGMREEAFRLLVPKGWSFKGEVTWDIQRFPPEPYSSYEVASSDGASVFQQFPHVTLFWSQDPTLQQAYAQNGIEVMQPLSAEQALRELYLPAYRAEVSGGELLETQPLPEVARQALQWQQTILNIFASISPFEFQYQLAADAARAKFRYTLAGKPMVEDVTVVITYFTAYSPSIYGTVPAITWIAVPTSFRAPAAEMDNRLETFRTIAASRRDNPVWHEHVTKFSAIVTREQLRQQRAIFEKFQQIRRTQAETSDMLFESWQRRSQAYDRIFDNYSQAIRGVDTYVDPVSSTRVELPNGYRHAWSNGSEYVLSDDPGFNPNTGSTRTWTEIHPQR